MKAQVKMNEIAEKAKSGDERAINMLVRSYHRNIYKMIYYRTGSVMDAEDITQDVFVKMIGSLPHLRDASRFRPWLYRIAVNCVNDHFRKKRLLSFLIPGKSITDAENDAQDPADTPSEVLMKKDFHRSLSRFAGQLSRKEREVFLLKFIDHLTLKEIAEALNKSESTVKTLLYRGIRKFRDNEEFRKLLGGEANG